MILKVLYFIFELDCSNSEKSGKKRAYTYMVKSKWKQALSRTRKQGCGRKAVLEFASYDVTGCDLQYLLPHHSLAACNISLSPYSMRQG